MLVLAFGLKTAPYIFNLFAEALHWIIERHIPAALCHYLDDFILIFHPDWDLSICYAAVEWVIALGQELGLCFQDSKTVWPCTTLEFLGLEIDSLAMEARLPPDKLSFLCDMLVIGQQKRSAHFLSSRGLWATCSFVPRLFHALALICISFLTLPHHSQHHTHPVISQPQLVLTFAGGQFFRKSGMVYALSCLGDPVASLFLQMQVARKVLVVFLAHNGFHHVVPSIIEIEISSSRRFMPC